ncbi:MAG TPA: tail fiber domain-containing protein, partial [Cyclobacteriaceae bacterium]
ADSINARIAVLDTLQVEDQALIGGDLTVSGLLVADTLQADSLDARIITSDTLIVDDLLTVGDSLNVGSNTNIIGSVNVGDSIIISNNADVGQILRVGDSLNVAKNASVEGSQFIGDSLVVTNNVNVGGDLDVDGNINLTGDLDLDDITADSIVFNYGRVADSLIVEDSLIVRKNIIVSDSIVIGDTVILGDNAIQRNEIEDGSINSDKVEIVSLNANRLTSGLIAQSPFNQNPGIMVAQSTITDPSSGFTIYEPEFLETQNDKLIATDVNGNIIFRDVATIGLPGLNRGEIFRGSTAGEPVAFAIPAKEIIVGNNFGTEIISIPFEGAITLTDDANFKLDSIVVGDGLNYSDDDSTGIINLGGALTENRSIILDGNILTIDATGGGSLFIDGDINADSIEVDIALINNLLQSDSLRVDNNTSINGFVQIGDSLSVGSDLRVIGDIRADSLGSRVVGVSDLLQSDDSLQVSGNANIAGDLVVSGNFDLSGSDFIADSINARIAVLDTLQVEDQALIGGDLTVSDLLVADTLQADSLDARVITADSLLAIDGANKIKIDASIPSISLTDGTSTSIIDGSVGQLNISAGNRIEINSDTVLITAIDTVRVDGSIIPVVDDNEDLGSSTKRWKDIYATNSMIQTSDMRFKQDIKPLTYGLSEINKLNPTSYYWKSDSVRRDLKIGLIAQEVLKIIPEAVHNNDDTTKTLGLSYSELIPVLINAIKEQQTQIDSLTKEVSIKSQDLKDQKSELINQSEMIKQLKAESEDIKSDMQLIKAALGITVPDDKSNIVKEE